MKGGYFSEEFLLGHDEKHLLMHNVIFLTEYNGNSKKLEEFATCSPAKTQGFPTWMVLFISANFFVALITSVMREELQWKPVAGSKYMEPDR